MNTNFYGLFGIIIMGLLLWFDVEPATAFSLFAMIASGYAAGAAVDIYKTNNRSHELTIRKLEQLEKKLEKIELSLLDTRKQLYKQQPNINLDDYF